jgi:excisionase family DNA binding protein
MFDIKDLKLENRIFTYEIKFYTVPQVAKLLGFSKSYVYDLINSHKLKAVKFSARRTRIPQLSLNEFILQGMDNSIKNNTSVQPPSRGQK